MSNELVVSSPSAGLSQSGTGSSKQFLTFRIGGEEYGIDILKVQEIRSYEAPTRIAHAPHFVKGVVNLRGVIVPIMDMRLKLGTDAQYNDFTVTIRSNQRPTWVPPSTPATSPGWERWAIAS
jgi:purine-binding chemotaxis protein CheW